MILICDKRALLRTSDRKSLDELRTSDLRDGYYQSSLSCILVAYTDGERYKILKNKDGPFPVEPVNKVEFYALLSTVLGIHDYYIA